MLDKAELRLVCFYLRPDIDDATFDDLWEEFMQLKYLRTLH